MTEKAHAIIFLLRLLVVFFIFATILSIFVYSPFYSKSALWLLDHYVNQNVDPIAAESQKMGNLSAESALEPGSPEWIARRAYLSEVDRVLQDKNSHDFINLQKRYQLLLKLIETEKQENDENLLIHSTKEDTDNEDETPLEQETFYQKIFSHENEPLYQSYKEFLASNDSLLEMYTTTPVKISAQTDTELLIFKKPAHQPHAIVILGGGLTSGEFKGEIVVNRYTEKRLQKGVDLFKDNQLPIVLSGVEAPYMQRWLEQHNIHAEFLENKSMNTCENTRFSSLLLQKQGGAPTVYLVTDAYHMPRSQRLFAINGIATIPIIAALPNELTEWQPSYQNLMHSRRATYEVLATLRDIWFGESNCRETP